MLALYTDIGESHVGCGTHTFNMLSLYFISLPILPCRCDVSLQTAQLLFADCSGAAGTLAFGWLTHLNPYHRADLHHPHSGMPVGSVPLLCTPILADLSILPSAAKSVTTPAFATLENCSHLYPPPIQSML